MKIVREMLKALEAGIAAVECTGTAGFTRAGVFMMELLSKMRVSNQEDLWRLIAKLDQAAMLVADDAAESGRRSPPPSPHQHADILTTKYTGSCICHRMAEHESSSSAKTNKSI